MTKTKKQKIKALDRQLNSTEVQAWFTRHGATMRVAIESVYNSADIDWDIYVGDSENVFISADGTERLTASVSYKEGCPTCGGAYVKEWRLVTTH